MPSTEKGNTIISRIPRSINSKNPNINDSEDGHSEEASTNNTKADEGELFGIVGVDITNSEIALQENEQWMTLIEIDEWKKMKEALKEKNENMCQTCSK